jgi:hypothetical protein
MAEVKRAYRLLAKAFHPDSAGDAATPRFLAIQDAYEQLRTGRAPATSVPKAQRAPSPPAEEPWRADPARARAARERARTARGSASHGSSNGGSATGTNASGAANGGSSGSGSRSGTSGTASPGGRGAGRRSTRKATMGSTSYDEARDVNDPTWSGASWYGPSSGEYWIVNPREYADPRKHGPEYQQRARRPLGDVDSEATTEGVSEPAVRGATAAGARAEAPAAGAAARGEWRSATAAGRGPRASAWSRPGAAGTTTRTAGGPDVASAAPRPGEARPDGPAGDAFGLAARTWLGGQADDPLRRLGPALIAWPPLGLAAAVAIDEVTGCAAYAASCGPAEPMLPWLAQAVILGFMLLLPPVTRLLVGGSIGVLLALVPVTAFLVAVGGAGAPQAAGVMAVLLAAAWVAGVGWSAAATARRRGAAGGAGTGSGPADRSTS